MRGIRISVAAGIVIAISLMASAPASAADPTDCLTTPPTTDCELLTSAVSDRKVSVTAGDQATMNLDVLQVVTTNSPFPAPGDPAVQSDWHVHACPSGLASVTIDWGDGSTSAPIASTPLSNGTEPVIGQHTYAAPGSYPVHATTSNSSCLVGDYGLATVSGMSGTVYELHKFIRGYVVNVSAPSPPPTGCTDNSLTLGKPKQKGKSVVVSAGVNCPGTIEVSSKKKLTKPLTVTADPANPVKMRIKLSKAGKKRLKSVPKLKLKLSVSFTPTGGTASVHALKAKIKPPKK